MKNYYLLIAYDGTNYLGWQKTRYGKSIQEEIEDKLSKILQEDIFLQAASRTDKGVHAYGQVANFTTSSNINKNKLLHSLNRLLPKDIIIREIKEMPISFHPSLDSKKKEYVYHLFFGPYQLPKQKNFSWHFPYKLNIELMQKEKEKLLGKNNFSSFANKKHENPFCTIFSIDIALSPCEIAFHIVGDKFLYKMVRNIVGTLAYIASGKLDKNILPYLLKNSSRKDAGMSAPAKGLTLQQVYYD